MQVNYQNKKVVARQRMLRNALVQFVVGLIRRDCEENKSNENKWSRRAVCPTCSFALSSDIIKESNKEITSFDDKIFLT